MSNLQDPAWQAQTRENFAKVREHRAAALSELKGIIEACGDHPALIGYVVGKDDGKCVLYPTPEPRARCSLRLPAITESRRSKRTRS